MGRRMPWSRISKWLQSPRLKLGQWWCAHVGRPLTIADQKPSMTQSRKLASFEGLRGIAAFVVVLNHLRLTFYARSSDWIAAELNPLPSLVARPLRAFIEGFYNGTFAVWLFWIMSGFVLSMQFFLRV